MTYLESAEVTGRRQGASATALSVPPFPGSADGIATSGWVNPTPGGPTPGPGSLFGDPRTGHTHAGVDIGFGLGAGAGVRAAAAGTVTWSKSDNGGWILWVDHGGGWVTKYMHLGTKDGSVNPYAVTNGSRVMAGQIIGYMGDTGNPAAGAYHVHFEMVYKGRNVDPSQTGVLTGTVDYAALDQQVSPSTAQTRAQSARQTLGGYLGAMSDYASGGNRLTYDQILAQRQRQQARAGEPGATEGVI